MAEHRVKVLGSVYIITAAERFRTEKPEGYTFIPDQTAYMRIDKPDWQTKVRPFTFTSRQEWPDLELIVRIYRNHHGGHRAVVQAPHGRPSNAGRTLRSHQFQRAWSVLRSLRRHHALSGHFPAAVPHEVSTWGRQIHSNRTAQNVSMHEELTQLLRKDHNVFTRQNVFSRNERHVDGARLIELAPDLSQRFYICGHKASFATL